MKRPPVATTITRNTLGFASLLFALWYAALSQGNGAAYALFFFIVALALVSWLHAKRNLRGLSLRAGRIEAAFVGGEVQVPITITAGSGNFAAGVEIRALSGGERAVCGFIRQGESEHVVITVPATQRGALATLDLELRSLWPIGLLAARSRITLDVSYVVQPAPAGTQQLPAGEPGWRYDRRKGRGDGDEFAGLREFRAGESPRRIHWRAAERTDKLLIKEWEGASGGLRWLDWNDLEVSGVEARLAQLSRWVLEADRTGAPYGLRLPGVTVPAALGPAHRARCLHALAAFPGAAEPPPKPKKRARLPEPPILPGPFAGLLIALGLASLPLLTTVYPFSAGMFVLAVIFRFVTRLRNSALRSIWPKLLVVGIGISGVLMSSSSLIGLEPGLSLLISLMALKTLESATRRDFFVLVLLTWFLALCGLFISQTLLAATAAVALCLLAAAAAGKLYSEGHMPWRIALKRTGLMAAQALPIIALFFIFFPRIQGGIRFSFMPGGQGAAGFSEDFDPGNFAMLNDNLDTAFRAEFINSEPPGPADRYWRGLVLWRCEGLSWRRGTVAAIEPRAPKVPDGAFRQRITMQPHGQRWLFALDRPLYPPKDATLEPGAYAQAIRPINRSTRYDVVSLPGFKDRLLPKEQRAAALALPAYLPPETRKLGELFKRAGNDAAILARGIQWFQTQGFTYSLQPDRYGGSTALDDFLFQRRVGFCSHYAASFGTLMRIAGVPARVVLGYQGGEHNPHGNYFLVRQNDAHAWCEVWIEGHGWQRVDLTAQLAPSRIETGAESFRETAGSLGGRFRQLPGFDAVFDGARMLWDNINYQWDLRVVAYDEDAQFELLARAGMKDLPRPLIILGVFAGTCVLLGSAGLWLRTMTRAARDPVADAWARACTQIARLSGAVREPWEGPLAYATRAAAAKPELADIFRRIADSYARIRFAAEPPSLALLHDATAALASR